LKTVFRGSAVFVILLPVFPDSFFNFSFRISSTVFLCLNFFACLLSSHTNPFFSFLSFMLSIFLLASTLEIKAAVSLRARDCSTLILCFLSSRS
uniref:Uncharacterized protein n=1 Tax=Ciona intestinalis TaxID=7719 RepID=H2XPW7_CIOIN